MRSARSAVANRHPAQNQPGSKATSDAATRARINSSSKVRSSVGATYRGFRSGAVGCEQHPCGEPGRSSLAKPCSYSTRIERLAVAGDAVVEVHAGYIVAKTASDQVHRTVFGLYEVVSCAAEDHVAALTAVE